MFTKLNNGRIIISVDQAVAYRIRLRVHVIAQAMLYITKQSY